MDNKKDISSDDSNEISFEDFKRDVLNDFRVACESRHISIFGRKEVLNGKAKFAVSSDG